MKIQAGPFLVQLTGCDRLERHESLHVYSPGTEFSEELSLEREAPRKLNQSLSVDDELPGQWRVRNDGLVQFWCGETGQWALEARFSSDYRSVKVAAQEGNPKSEALAFHLGSPLKWMVIHRLAAKGGFLLHGVCLRSPAGSVILGTGPSGAGKSTLGSFFLPTLDWKVLTDETIAVIPANEGTWRAWGTPWSGMLGAVRNEGGPVDALFFLAKTKIHHIEPVERREAFRRVWSEVFPPPSDPTLSMGLIGSVEEFILNVPVFELGFSKDPSVVEFLRQADTAY